MMPGLRLSLAMTANKAANETMQFPTNSRRTASHLHMQRYMKIIKKHLEEPSGSFNAAAMVDGAYRYK